MLAAVVLGGIIPCAGFFVVEYRRNQAKHDACELRLESLIERYHALVEKLAGAFARKDDQP